MIDTIAVRQVIPDPDFNKLRAYGYKTKEIKSEAGMTFHAELRAEAGSHLPYISVTKLPFDDEFFAKVEGSLPKVINGQNVCELDKASLADALDMFSDYTSAMLRTTFDVREAQTQRVDYCASFATGDERNIRPIIAAISHATPARMKRTKHEDTTCTFWNAQREICCYGKRKEVTDLLAKNKAVESDVELADGVFRVEHRYKTAAANRLALKLGFKTEQGKPDRRVKFLVTPEAAERVMSDTLDVIGLNLPIVSRDARDAIFSRTFGQNADALLRFAEQCEDDKRGSRYNHLWKAAGYSSQAFARRKKVLRDAGLWLTAEQPIPVTFGARLRPAAHPIE